MVELKLFFVILCLLVILMVCLRFGDFKLLIYLILMFGIGWFSVLVINILSLVLLVVLVVIDGVEIVIVELLVIVVVVLLVDWVRIIGFS